MAESECFLCHKMVKKSILDWHVNEHLKDPSFTDHTYSQGTLVKPPRSGPLAAPVRPTKPSEVPSACPFCNRLVVPSKQALHNSWCGRNVVVQCSICLEDVDVEGVHTFNCSGSHRFCNGCSVNLFVKALNDKSLARCPSCRDAVHSTDLRELKSLVPAGTLQAYEEVERSIIMGQFLSCSTPACPFVIDVPVERRDDQHGINCPVCHRSMCSRCRMQPYHPGLQCSEASVLKETWLAFVVKEGRMSAAFIKDQRDRMLRHNELQRDETFKEQHCRMCPHCGRVVQKLEGCDAMRCGVDYHGGNNQNGCGNTFRWESAAPYVALLPPAPSLDAINEKLLCTHAHGPYHRCVGGHEIVGPRFQCCNCPGESVECCHACLPDLLATHPPDHYFVVHTTSAEIPTV